MNFILFLLSFYRNHSQGLLYLDEGLTAQLMNKIVHFIVWKILIFFSPLSLPKRINLYIVRTILFVLFWFQSCSYNYVHVCMRAQLLQLCLDSVTLQAVVHQAPLSMGFSRQEYWNGLPCPPPGGLPDIGIKPTSPALAGEFFTHWVTWEASIYNIYFLKKKLGNKVFCTKNVAISTS